MSEFINIQVGQCGNQIGGAFWPLALQEYGIETKINGVNQLKIQTNYRNNADDLSNAFSSFFYVPESATKDLSFKKLSHLVEAKVKARAILIDMEDSTVAKFANGPLRNLFDQTCTVTNYPGSGNNWAVGHLTHGKVYQEKIQETIRVATERCENLHGFILMHSVGGGTGSGLGTAVLNILQDEYPHIDRFVNSIYPGEISQDVITAPYNVLLSTNELIEKATCVFPADNGALLDICQSQIEKKNNIDQIKYNSTGTPFQDMNSIIVNMLLHLTSGARFPGCLNTDINDLATNLVPYPQLHYIFSSVSPISLTAPRISINQNKRMQDELFINAWSRSHQLIKFDPLNLKSVVMAAAHVTRGNCSMEDIRRNIERFQAKAKFTPWSREAMKIGICSVPPPGHPASLLCLINSTSMRYKFKTLINQFDMLYKRNAHIHHYLQVDGFEKETFLHARETLESICERYREINNQKMIDIPRLSNSLI